MLSDYFGVFARCLVRLRYLREARDEVVIVDGQRYERWNGEGYEDTGGYVENFEYEHEDSHKGMRNVQLL